MSQKNSPILFNNNIFNQSKWFNKNINKFALNEDLQIREIINIIFKHSITSQFFFIDKIIIYKYNTKIKIYIYFFCNFRHLKKNIVNTPKEAAIRNLAYYIYIKYNEFLNIKKIEIIKILKSLLFKDNNIFLYFKNINYIYNSNKFLASEFKAAKTYYNFKHLRNTYKTKKNVKNSVKKNYKFKKIVYINNNKNNYYKKPTTFKKFYFKRLKYFKTIHFILYLLCYQRKTLLPLHISSLLSVIKYELDKLENTSKNFSFLFYSIFNLIRECLEFYMTDQKCSITGLRIQVKGRFFISKRKRIFVFTLGELNLNKISFKKDYSSIDLIKATGVSSIKIWVNYK